MMNDGKVWANRRTAKPEMRGSVAKTLYLRVDTEFYLSCLRPEWIRRCMPCGVFPHDVTAAMSVSQIKEMAAMLMSKTKPLGIELYFHANTFFCFSKPIWPVVT